jgi:hypothetical protein
MDSMYIYVGIKFIPYFTLALYVLLVWNTANYNKSCEKSISFPQGSICYFAM